jgi:hypothetical protein
MLNQHLDLLQLKVLTIDSAEFFFSLLIVFLLGVGTKHGIIE